MKNSTIVQSTKWSAIAEFLARIMTPLINIILARALAPKEFGLVATFTLVITFAEVFTDAGFQKYLIQHEFASRDDLEKSANVAFWTNLGISVVFWCLICIFRDPIAVFVGSPGHGMEIAILGLQIPLVAFSSIQTSLFRRDFKFKQLLPIRLGVAAVPLLVTVPLAFGIKNCWAIVIGNLCKEFVNATVLTIRSSWRPKLYYSVNKLKEMTSDTLWLMADSFAIWATSYASTFIVSRYLDSHYLGIYKTGATTIIPYISLLYTMTAPVLFSALSRLQNDQQERDKVFLTYQNYASYIVILLGIAVFVFRDTVTLLLLGSNWSEASLILGMTGLSLSVSVIIAQYNSDYFRASGRPYIALAVQSAYVVVLVTTLIWAVKMPFQVLCGISGSMSFAYSLISMIGMWIFFRISIFKTIKNIFPSLCGAAVFAVVGVALRGLLGEGILYDLLSGCVCVLAYVLTILVFPQARATLKQVPFVSKLLKK